MQVRTSEMPVVIDVDETLISKPFQSIKGVDGSFHMDYYGKMQLHTPITRHVDLLKSYKARGYEVTVWSANGVQWAKQAVEKLGLEDYVDWVASKPLKAVDDKDPSVWLTRVFIDE